MCDSMEQAFAYATWYVEYKELFEISKCLAR